MPRAPSSEIPAASSCAKPGNNLRGRQVTVDIPKRHLVVTSASGSSAVVHVVTTCSTPSTRIAAVDQRDLPAVRSLVHAPLLTTPQTSTSWRSCRQAVVTDKARMDSDARSTVETASDAPTGRHQPVGESGRTPTGIRASASDACTTGDSRPASSLRCEARHPARALSRSVCLSGRLRRTRPTSSSPCPQVVAVLTQRLLDEFTARGGWSAWPSRPPTPRPATPAASSLPGGSAGPMPVKIRSTTSPKPRCLRRVSSNNSYSRSPTRAAATLAARSSGSSM